TYALAYHRNLHSFPTRRSSDLPAETLHDGRTHSEADRHAVTSSTHRGAAREARPCTRATPCPGVNAGVSGTVLPNRRASTNQSRSEEHTSELQSQSNLVCRLPL